MQTLSKTSWKFKSSENFSKFLGIVFFSNILVA